MRYGALSFLFICLLLITTGCDRVSNQKVKVKGAYAAYEKARISGSLAALRQTVTTAQGEKFAAPDAAGLRALASMTRPPVPQIMRVVITDRNATIELEGTLVTATFAGTLKGTVTLKKEEGAWKADKEKWSVDMEPVEKPESEIQVPDTAARPDGYEKLIGTWNGFESGSTDDRWRFVFDRDYRVSVAAPDGPRYDALAMADGTLGVEEGPPRVLPGGAVMDLIIVRSDQPDRRGKTELGSFRLSGTTLQVCFGEPGLMKRTGSFASIGGIHCYELRRPAAPEPAETPDSVVEWPDGATVAAEKSKGDPGVTGEAEVVFDGKKAVYPILTGPSSDTRFAQPNRAKVQFRFVDPRSGSARRIELLLDATKAGVHRVDGKFLADNMFGLDKVDTFVRTEEGWNAGFQWVADGGQLYFPKTVCTIVVSSPYTGRPDSRFAGQIKDCTVVSAGIEHTIKSAAFEMKGVPAQ